MKCNAGWGERENGLRISILRGVQPDILCVAKALSGGYVPVGAVVARSEIMTGVFNSMERLRGSFEHVWAE